MNKKKDQELLRKQFNRIAGRASYKDKCFELEEMEAEEAATRSLINLYDRLHPSIVTLLGTLVLNCLEVNLLVCIFVLFVHLNRSKGG